MTRLGERKLAGFGAVLIENRDLRVFEDGIAGGRGTLGEACFAPTVGAGHASGLALTEIAVLGSLTLIRLRPSTKPSLP